MPAYDSIEEYLAEAPEEGRAAYERVLAAVHADAPDATVRFSYGIPTFFVDGRRLLHAATWKDHLALYPPPPGVDVSSHLHGKGTIRIPYAAPWPTELVQAVVAGHLARVGRD